MAWTVTVKKQTVVGDMRALILDCSADAATQNLVTGLQQIYGFATGPKSLTTGAPKIFANSGSAGTAIAGVLGCSGFTSGDELIITVYGR